MPWAANRPGANNCRSAASASAASMESGREYRLEDPTPTVSHARWRRERSKRGEKQTPNRPPRSEGKNAQARNSLPGLRFHSRDGGIRTRDPLNPIRLRETTKNDNMPDLQGVPSVGAGLPALPCRTLPGVSAPVTATTTREAMAAAGRRVGRSLALEAALQKGLDLALRQPRLGKDRGGLLLKEQVTLGNRDALRIAVAAIDLRVFTRLVKPEVRSAKSADDLGPRDHAEAPASSSKRSLNWIP